MRTTIAGTRVVVKAEIENACLDEDNFGYKEGHLGVLMFDWEQEDNTRAVADITVIWDHDPEKLLRKVLLDNISAVGVERNHIRVLLSEVE